LRMLTYKMLKSRRNAKLKQALKEHKARFMRLERRDKGKANLIVKLDDDIKEIK
ncbi:16742_t:CDS:1, partial [Dentiscutata heterogama]